MPSYMSRHTSFFPHILELWLMLQRTLTYKSGVFSPFEYRPKGHMIILCCNFEEQALSVSISSYSLPPSKVQATGTHFLTHTWFPIFQVLQSCDCAKGDYIILGLIAFSWLIMLSILSCMGSLVFFFGEMPIHIILTFFNFHLLFSNFI